MVDPDRGSAQSVMTSHSLIHYYCVCQWESVRERERCVSERECVCVGGEDMGCGTKYYLVNV